MPLSDQDEGMARHDDFNEADHPRAEDGRFGSGGGSSGPKLTTTEKSYLQDYTGDHFLKTNTELREGKSGDSGMVKHLDSALSKATLPEGTKLYRGMTKDAAIKLFGGRDLKAGQVFSDKAFASTGKSKDSVSSFYALGGVMLEIETDKGQHGLDIQDLSNNKHEGGGEVLLPRNTKMEIQSISPPKSAGKPIIVKVRTVSSESRNDAEAGPVIYNIETSGPDQDEARKDSEIANGTIRAAGILFVTQKLECLFLKRGPGGDYPGMWATPGGRIEDGETGIEAAIRETLEEAGYEAKAEDITVWTRRIAQHETTGAPPTPAPGQEVPSIVETDALNAPGNAFMASGPEVDFTTFICRVPEAFTPKINDESVGWAWSPIDQAPEPLHPGVRVALDRFGMDELGIARAMLSGDLTSPQFYENVAIFDIRISGTGDAYRTARDEFVYRPPEAWLSPDLLPRYNGLPVLWLHTDKPMLDTTEFAQRIVGTVMLPYVKGDEVWGISKIWDMPAAKIMGERQLSTSPGVIFRGGGTNTKLKLEDGRTLVIEGNPDLMDHVAICEMGVWDKGGAPAGVKSSEIIGDTDMTMEDAARKDADKEVEKTEDRKDEGGSNIDKFLSKMDSKLDSLCSRMDAVEAKKDADADDKKAEDDKKDADGDPEMTAADSKKDEDEKEAKEEAARKDAEISALTNRLAALERVTRPVAEADRALFARAQARADGVFQAFGDAAPRQMQGEDLIDYRRRLVAPLLKHSAAWKGVDISGYPDDVISRVEDQVYHDAALAARNPADIPAGTLRARERRDGTGRTITEFMGEPRSWMAAFTSGRRGLTGFNTKQERA